MAISDLLVDLNQDVSELLHYLEHIGKIMGKEPKERNLIYVTEQLMRTARKEGSLKDYTLEDFTKLLDNFKSNYRIKSSIS